MSTPPEAQPIDIEKMRQEIMDSTYLMKEGQWWNNLVVNGPTHREGKSISVLKGRFSGPAVVLGAGPSVSYFKQIDILRKYKEKFAIIASDKMLMPLVRKKVYPEFVLSVDADDFIDFFYPYRRPDVEAEVHCLWWLSITPYLVKRWQGDVYWFAVALDDPKNLKAVTKGYVAASRGKEALSSFGNAGGFCFSMAAYLGYNPIILVGIDMGYGDKVKKEDTVYWQGFLSKENSLHPEERLPQLSDRARANHFKYYKTPFGINSLTDEVFDLYKEIYVSGIKAIGKEVYNCSPYSTIFGDFVKSKDLEETLKTLP